MNAPRVEARAKALSALQQLGFGEGAIRRVLAELDCGVDGRHDAENVLRDALAKPVA